MSALVRAARNRAARALSPFPREARASSEEGDQSVVHGTGLVPHAAKSQGGLGQVLGRPQRPGQLGRPQEGLPGPVRGTAFPERLAQGEEHVADAGSVGRLPEFKRLKGAFVVVARLRRPPRTAPAPPALPLHS